MSLVLPKEEEVEKIFTRILSSESSCERLLDTFYNHLGDNPLYVDPDSKHFAQVLLNAYKNGDVSALLLEICNRSMFDLLKARRNLLQSTNIKNFMRSIWLILLLLVQNYI